MGHLKELASCLKEKNPFSGKTELLSGDWKYILLVVHHRAKPQTGEATIKYLEAEVALKSIVGSRVLIARIPHISEDLEFFFYSKATSYQTSICSYTQQNIQK